MRPGLSSGARGPWCPLRCGARPSWSISTGDDDGDSDDDDDGPLPQLPDEPAGGAEAAPARGLRCPGPGLLPHRLLVSTAVLINIISSRLTDESRQIL